MTYNVLIKLFKTFCCSFYGSQTWTLSNNDMQHVYTTYNRGIRILLNLPHRTHRTLLPLLIDSDPLDVQLCRRFQRLSINVASLPKIDSIFMIFFLDPRSISSQNLHLFHNSPKPEYSDAQVATGRAIIEITDSLKGVNEINGFSKDEMEMFLDHLCVD